MRVCVRFVSLLLALCFVTFPAKAADTADVQKRIKELASKAQSIVLDGNDSDWAGIPQIRDATGDCDGAERDFIAVSIAPRQGDLLLRVHTWQSPTREKQAYWLDLDFYGRHMKDIRLDISPRSSSERSVWVYGVNGKNRNLNVNGIEVATGKCLEIRVPYASLKSALPESIYRYLTDSKMRPWMRAIIRSYDSRSRKWLDSAAIASYRLLDETYPLDASSNEESATGKKVSLSFPLWGNWFVAQESFTSGTHAGSWAYDFMVLDTNFAQQTNQPDELAYGDASDSYAYGQRIRSPLPGTVLIVRGNLPDKGIDDGNLGTKPDASSGNYVVLDIGNDTRLEFQHMRSESLQVAAGDKIKTGDTLGQVGNSGRTVSPHLHLQARRASDRQSMPIFLKNVRVRLNPVNEDPWQRDLTTWAPREGYFVQSTNR